MWQNARTDMPISTDWKSHNLVHTRYYDEVKSRDVVRNAMAVSSDPRFDTLRFVYSDWRDVGNFDLTIKDIEELVAYTEAFAKTNPNIWHAIVMPDQETAQAFAGMYRFLSTQLPWQTELFHSLADAKAWIEHCAMPAYSI